VARLLGSALTVTVAVVEREDQIMSMADADVAAVDFATVVVAVRIVASEAVEPAVAAVLRQPFYLVYSVAF